MIGFMNKRVFLLLAIVFVFDASAFASTVKWLVKPQYDTIGYFNTNIFKCKANGKWQLIDSKGVSLLPYAVDSITDCKEGYALVLEKVGDRFKIKGFFTESNRQFILINDSFYTGPYSYFSEGYLSVADPKTLNFGYLDVTGKVVIPFKYRQARPFIKGLASVELAKKKRQTIYIHKNGKPLSINHSGSVVIGSSFNQNGEALVAYYDNDNAIINTRGEVIREYVKKGEKPPIRSYDFAFDESGTDYDPKQNINLSFDSSITTFSKNGLIGFKKEQDVLVPAQFTQAEPFANGCAIVSLNDKYGILSLMEGTFSASLNEDNSNRGAGKEPSKYVYTLSIPESINQQAEVKLDTGDGILRTISLENNTYRFSPAVEKDAQEFVFRAQVIVDGLLVLDDESTQSLNNIQLTIGQPFCVTEYADGNDIVRIRIMIANNSDLAISVSTYFSVKFAKDSNNSLASKTNSSAKIAPGTEKEFFVDLKVVEAESVKVSVSVRANKIQCGTKSSTFELKPFY